LSGEAAPLFSTPDAPIPAGGAAEWFAGAGDARLRAALFPPRDASAGVARGSVVLSPGRTEPIEKYFEAVGRLNAAGYQVLVHDWRGHGLSRRLGAADRGHARGWRDFLTDYSALLDAFAARLPKPWIALGHSMGGCLTLLALAQGERRFAGAVLSSPMLGLYTGQVPLAAARVLAGGLTTVGLGQGLAVARTPPEDFENNVLTHDAARFRRNNDQILAHPELAVGPPTWAWLDFAFRATGILQNGLGVPAIGIPVSVVAAGDERVVDNAATERVARRLRDARLTVIPGAYHELMQETDEIQAQFWRAFDALGDRIATGGPGLAR
jgi:lysophospholipase